MTRGLVGPSGVVVRPSTAVRSRITLSVEPVVERAVHHRPRLGDRPPAAGSCEVFVQEEPVVRRLSGPGIGWRGTSPLERLVIVGVVAAAIVLAGMILFADRLRPASDIVGASRSALAHPPALDVRLRLPWDATIRVLHDGHGTWRREYPSSGRAYSYDLWSGGRFAFYNADLQVFVETDPGSRRSYLPSWGDADCADAVRLGDESVAGRDAYRISCADTEFWVDRGSLLVLRERGRVADMEYVEEIVSLRLDPIVRPSLFRFDPPPGARVITMDQYRAISFPTAGSG